MGIAGNKGAVAIRMDYGDTSFCFLAAHFASGTKQAYKIHDQSGNSEFIIHYI
jgi:hypothetical protein